MMVGAGWWVGWCGWMMVGVGVGRCAWMVVHESGWCR